MTASALGREIEKEMAASHIAADILVGNAELGGTCYDLRWLHHSPGFPTI